MSGNEKEGSSSGGGLGCGCIFLFAGFLLGAVSFYLVFFTLFSNPELSRRTCSWAPVKLLRGAAVKSESSIIQTEPEKIKKNAKAQKSQIYQEIISPPVKIEWRITDSETTGALYLDGNLSNTGDKAIASLTIEASVTLFNTVYIERFDPVKAARNNKLPFLKVNQKLGFFFKPGILPDEFDKNLLRLKVVDFTFQNGVKNDIN